MKIRPNDPCPCGSGKKYKKCCKGKSATIVENYENRVYQYMRTHNSAEILNTIVALQLNPENRGTVVRLEELSRYAALTIHEGGLPVVADEFKAILNSEFAYDVNEDFPANLHADILSAIGGTHIVFPGIAVHTVEILQTICDTLYMSGNKYPDSFMSVVTQGFMLLLMLGDLMAERAHISGMIKGGDRRGQVLDYTGIENDYSISSEELMAFMDRYGISQGILDSFTIDITAKRDALLNRNSSDNPLYDQPLVKCGDSYYFLLISNQVDALRRFVLRIADICECLPSLMDGYHNIEWNAIMQVCDSMEWGLTDIKVPEPIANTRECVCHIDANWLAYVVYCHDNEKEVRNEFASLADVSSRINANESYIAENIGDSKNILVVILTSTMGEPGSMMWDQILSHPHVLMATCPFIQLSKLEQWKKLDLLHFAECYRDNQSMFFPTINMVDAYALYKQHNYSFYMSDAPRSTIFVHIDVDSGYDIIQDSKLEANYHSIQMIWDGNLVSVPIARNSKYFPVYAPTRQAVPYLNCVENGKFPIWVSCRQNIPQAITIADTYGLAILYWIYRINETTQGEGIVPLGPTEITLSFDEKVLKPMMQKDDVVSDELPYEFTTTPIGVQMQIHLNGLLMMQKTDNSGERQMMKDLINALCGNNKGESLVDSYIPQDLGKMILLYNTDATTMANRTKLLRPLMIAEPVKQHLYDILPKWMEEKGLGFSGKIEEQGEKERVLRNIVSVLFEKLDNYIRQFEYKSLLYYAVWSYESLVWKRDEKKVIDPARAYCFGIDDKMRAANNKEEQQLTEAGLSLRCLIEYLAAQPHVDGNRKAEACELEYMMAIMAEIISYGTFCDAIHLGVSEQEVECLPSGRYGIYQDDFSDVVSAFQTAYGEDMLAGQMSAFGERFEEISGSRENSSIYPSLDEMDAAFQSEWGVSYQNIVTVCTSMSQMCVSRGEGILQIEEKNVINEVCKLSKLSNKVVRKVLGRLVLQARDLYLTAPDGFKNIDIYPWRYNRELSFTRRFIVRETDNEGIVYLTFGLRNAIASYKQLTYLLMQGQLIVENERSDLHKLVSKFSNIKGKLFNEQVRKYLKEHSSLIVIPYDVKISTFSPFNANDNYGDIDVLAFDTESELAYNIECKDTVMAKNIYQMKTEMDKYLGRNANDNSALISKHYKRHVWLNEHKRELAEFLGVTEVKEIKSFVLTASVLPVAYLRKKELLLPIKSYHEMERECGDLEKLLI